MVSKEKVLANILFVSLFMFCGGAGWAQSGTSKMDPPKSTMSADGQFVKEASSGGLAEVKLGQLAQEKGGNETVKKFGARMVNDHSKADDQLKAAASQSNMTVLSKMSAKDQELYNRLSKLSGSDFDREYATEMVNDHTHDIAAFRKEAANGQDEAIKNFASQTLPTLEEHLKLARGMEKSVSDTAATNSKVNDHY